MSSTAPCKRQVYLGDCLELIKQLPDDSVDAGVTDPPYGLSVIHQRDVIKALTAWLAGQPYVTKKKGFMQRQWDGFVPGPEIWREYLRVLKPGAHLVVFAAPRTIDLMGIALRLAGFEIRDTIAWLRGAGFPKSLDISKEIDAHLGLERPIIGYKDGVAGENLNDVVRGSGSVRDTTETGGKGVGAYGVGAKQRRTRVPITAPASDQAKLYEGYGTLLKPLYEPIIIARKPFKGTTIECVLEHGTGALNIDGCRVEHASPEDLEKHQTQVARLKERGGVMEGVVQKNSSDLAGANEVNEHGRFPPNVLLTHAPGCRLLGYRRTKGDPRGTPGGSRPGGFVDVGAYKGEGAPNSMVYGPEFQPVYQCGDGCPVGELEASTGVIRSTVRVGGDGEHMDPNGNWRFRRMSGGFEDEGTAAKYFPVFECDPSCPVKTLDQQSGVRRGMSSGGAHRPDYEGGMFGGVDCEHTCYGDEGGASIFFPTFPIEAAPGFCYAPRVSRREREAGCTHLPKRTAGESTGGRKEGSKGLSSPRAGSGRTEGAHNYHPTVKPDRFLRWLVRLVSFPGATVLDIFMGSGSTGIACVHENRNFIGFERDAGYLDVACARIDHAEKQHAETQEFKMPELAPR
jgi:DNA modification methylase